MNNCDNEMIGQTDRAGVMHHARYNIDIGANGLSACFVELGGKVPPFWRLSVSQALKDTPPNKE